MLYATVGSKGASSIIPDRHFFTLSLWLKERKRATPQHQDGVFVHTRLRTCRYIKPACATHAQLVSMNSHLGSFQLLLTFFKWCILPDLAVPGLCRFLYLRQTCTTAAAGTMNYGGEARGKGGRLLCACTSGTT